MQATTHQQQHLNAIAAPPVDFFPAADYSHHALVDHAAVTVAMCNNNGQFSRVRDLIAKHVPSFSKLHSGKPMPGAPDGATFRQHRQLEVARKTIVCMPVCTSPVLLMMASDPARQSPMWMSSYHAIDRLTTVLQMLAMCTTLPVCITQKRAIAAAVAAYKTLTKRIGDDLEARMVPLYRCVHDKLISEASATETLYTLIVRHTYDVIHCLETTLYDIFKSLVTAPSTSAQFLTPANVYPTLAEFGRCARIDVFHKTVANYLRNKSTLGNKALADNSVATRQWFDFDAIDTRRPLTHGPRWWMHPDTAREFFRCMDLECLL